MVGEDWRWEGLWIIQYMRQVIKEKTWKKQVIEWNDEKHTSGKTVVKNREVNTETWTGTKWHRDTSRNERAQREDMGVGKRRVLEKDEKDWARMKEGGKKEGLQHMTAWTMMEEGVGFIMETITWKGITKKRYFEKIVNKLPDIKYWLHVHRDNKKAMQLYSSMTEWGLRYQPVEKSVSGDQRHDM